MRIKIRKKIKSKSRSKRMIASGTARSFSYS